MMNQLNANIDITEPRTNIKVPVTDSKELQHLHQRNAHQQLRNSKLTTKNLTLTPKKRTPASKNFLLTFVETTTNTKEFNTDTKETPAYIIEPRKYIKEINNNSANQ